MKKILTTAAILACLSTTAFASSNHHNTTATAGALAGAYAGGGDANQGQKQGQVGINKSSNRNSTKQKQDASSSNNISVGSGDKTTINHKPAETAYAPIVIATSDCLGSVSAGGQGQFFGFTFGKTTESKPCNVRAFATLNVHNEDLFYAIQCQDTIVREAYKVLNTYNKYCIGAKAKSSTKKWGGFGKKSMYEESCPYPNSVQCKRKR